MGPHVEQAVQDIDRLGGKYHRAIVSVDFGRVATYTGDEIEKLGALRHELRSFRLAANARYRRRL
jgi:hypothetical protein